MLLEVRSCISWTFLHFVTKRSKGEWAFSGGCVREGMVGGGGGLGIGDTLCQRKVMHAR